MRREEITESGLGKIKPELIARKLAAIHNRENLPALKQIKERPRLIELLWFLQSASLKPGGIKKFCEDLIEANPNQLGTRTMRSAKSGNYTKVQRESIYRELGKTHKDAAFDPASLLTDGGTKTGRTEAFPETIRELTAEQIDSICRDVALRTIPKYLYELCIDKETDFSNGESYAQKPREWACCFGDVIEAVFTMMDRAEETGRKRIALTEVTRRVFQEMDYALQEKVMVRIEGESGFGKTESEIAWCEGRPGAARRVRVPASNSMKDFMIAIGEALGIDCSYGSSATGLREKIDYILKHSGLMIVFDECAYLIPRSYVQTSSPQRLEWVRDKIIDRGLPIVLSSTPTRWKSDVQRFVKKTGYTLEEFFRRNFLVLSLPTALSEVDMVAAARIHFPELDDDALGFIANEARLSQNYLQAVEAISKRARFLSKGRRIGLSIIEQAIGDVLPREQKTAQAQPVNPTPKKDFSKRVNSPFRNVEIQTFTHRSLRGTVPETTEAGLVTADS